MGPVTGADGGDGAGAVHRVDPSDEQRHPPGPEQLWNESYYLDFVNDGDGEGDGTLAGYVRKHHSYECPEIIAVAAKEISPDYRSWWDEVMMKPSD